MGEKIEAKCGHSALKIGCLSCLETAMAHDAAIKESASASRAVADSRVYAPGHEGLLVGQVVWVYDRHRFAVPLKAKVLMLSQSNDGVCVQLMQSNNSAYPIGHEVWLHAAQCRSVEIYDEPGGPSRETVAEVMRLLSEHAGETGASEGAVDVACRLSNFWRSWGAIAAKIRELNSLLGGAGPN